MAVEADPNSNPETSEAEPISEETEQAASTSRDVWVKGTSPSRKGNLQTVKKEDLVPGTKFTGIVRSVQQFGIFVDIGSFTDGLVHVSQISSDYVKDVKALFTIGQEVEVRLLEYDTQAGRISLTMRPPGDEKKGGPSRESSGGGTGMGKGGRTRRRPRYEEGDTILGVIKEITEEGALLTLPGDGEGFLPVSEQVTVLNSGARVTLVVDMPIEVRILSVEQGEITLTMKEEEYMDKEFSDVLNKKKEEEEFAFTKVPAGTEFAALEQLDEVVYDIQEGEEEGHAMGEVTEQADQAPLKQAPVKHSTVDLDSGAIFANPFTYTFLRSKYSANVKKKLELISAVKNEDSVVGEVAVSNGGSEAGSASNTEEPVAVAEAEGGEVAAVGAVSEMGFDPVAEEPGESEVAAVGAVTETASVLVSEEPVVASAVEEGEVAAAGAVSGVTESEVTSEVEKGEVTGAGAVPEAANSENASESTVSEASTGTTDSTSEDPAANEPVAVTSEVEIGEVTAVGAMSDSTVSENSASDSQAVLSESAASEIAGREETEEKVVSIKVGDEKTEVSEATPEASPTQAREVQGKDTF